MHQIFADRDTRIYLLGAMLSSFGDSALWLALGIWIKLSTGSSSAAGLSFFMYVFGSLFAPFGGVIVDRVRRRRLAVIANLATMVLVLSLLFVRDGNQLWLVYVVMFFYGVSSGVLLPVQTALLPAIVSDDLLGAANSALATVSQGFRLVTPLVGAGLLAVFGLAPVVLGDAVTFLIAAICLLLLRVRDDRPERSGRHWLGDSVDGIRFLLGNPVLRDVTIAVAVAIVGFGFSETVLFAVVSDGLHRPSTFLGVVQAVLGVGAILAGVLAPWLLRRFGEVRLVALGLCSSSIGFALEAEPNVAAVLAGGALIGASLPWVDIGIITLVQRRTPGRLLGRAEGGVSVALTVPQTIAIAVGAGLIAVLDYRIVLLTMTVLIGLPAIYLFMRRMPDIVVPSTDRPVGESTSG